MNNNKILNLIVKYGFGAVTAAVTMDGYRRTILNDRRNGQLDMIQKERESLSAENQKLLEDKIQEGLKQTKNKVAMVNYTEAADEHYKAKTNFDKDPSLYNKNELAKANKKLVDAMEEVKKLDLSEMFFSLYNNYIEFISNLSPDKLVCVFNIIIDGLVFSSFLTVLGIMLSEQVINKIT